ncbi:bifunctional transcriptional activator/DNA repair enzyme AdaA [Paenibacillus tarimensis]|uniref:bifunctional transcriptional activator/DNA repair enzyme AdaA n=1 Tax=Paenibacillus tarimensis TaxID=416012 RepID=UPI001F384896|nr:bifunctional transcriptional activator/DNA repair enzyme AdaA [Paenibacillus tarimensis]MCF2945530.1 bifunctional transcriptional activator/DNA repair enzyme AdaA [Paenibacillus tarimensis]
MKQTGGEQEHHKLTEEHWQAILANDVSYDQQFIYAVQTTGIFCRPSCKSRPPRRENVRLFSSADEALSQSFRPCKRCKPAGERLPDQEWVDQIASYLDKHYRESVTLESLAVQFNGSPYHLQRTFKRIAGITPVQYLQRKRITAAMELLSRSDELLSSVAAAVGLTSTAYFITLFKRITGVTPAHYRGTLQHNGTEVFDHEQSD